MRLSVRLARLTVRPMRLSVRLARLTVRPMRLSVRLARLTMRHLLIALVAATVLAAAAPALGQQADPSTVTVAVTRNWGPIADSWRAGGGAYVRLTDVKQALPTHVVVDSDQGTEAQVTLALSKPQPKGMPPGTVQVTITAPASIRAGGYTGTVDLGGSSALTVKVLVQDAIWWPILAVLVGALVGLLARFVARKVPWMQRMFGADSDPGHGASGKTVFSAAAALSMFTYVSGAYNGHTFGQWSQYLAAFFIGVGAHLLGHALNKAAPKRQANAGAKAG